MPRASDLHPEQAIGADLCDEDNPIDANALLSVFASSQEGAPVGVAMLAAILLHEHANARNEGWSGEESSRPSSRSQKNLLCDVLA